jgi:hypothetical protein
MGLAEYLGEEVAYNTGPPLVSIHHTEDGYYRTELPEFEYPEFHAAWGRISKLKDEIDLREKREREQQH